MPLYQLSIPAGTGQTHVPFIYFSNGRGGADRFCIVVTHRRLPPLETQHVCERIVQYHGSTDKLGRRATTNISGGYHDGDYTGVKLEFMRYIVVWGPGDVPEACVCMDTLCDVAWSAESPVSEKDMVACRGGLTAADVGPGNMCTVLPGSNARANRSRTLRFATTTHGTVVVSVSTFRDPDTRNGISIMPSRVARENAWGAAVKAVHPKKLMVRHLVRPPPPLPQGFVSCAAVNDDQFYESVSGHFVGDSTPRTMMVPRGGPGRAFRVDVGKGDEAGEAGEAGKAD